MKLSSFSKRQKSLAVGVICGLLSALCVGVYVLEVDQKAEAAQAQMLAKYGGDQIEVCVAKRDIAAGETISEGDVETRTWIATLLPSNPVTDRKEAIGKQVGSTILAGEVITTSRFGFNATDLEVPEGLVAISVPSREVQSVGAALKPGVLVDIYAVGTNSAAVRLAQTIQVLATSLESKQGSSGNANAWVTVAVSPEKVQELVSAAGTLDIYFTMPSSTAKDLTVENLHEVKKWDE